VSDVRVGRCLGPEGNGVSFGEGGEGGPWPPESWEDQQSMLSEEGGSMRKKEMQVGSDEEGPVRTE
jgi:hypothetical protein